MIVAARPFRGRRLRVRRVDEIGFAGCIGRRAVEDDEWVVDVTHGGDVANAYKYPANTECVFAISDPLGIVVYWTGRVPANKVTSKGAAEACLIGAEDLFDKRVGSVRRQAALDYAKRKHRQVIPAMMVIAAAADYPSITPMIGG